jgi:transaldolase
MGLFIDSAVIAEVRTAVDQGYVAGVTTNPTIMAKAGGDPERRIRELCAISPGPVFYQLTAPDFAGRFDEGLRFAAIDPAKVVLKIAATSENMRLLAALRGRANCAATAVYSGHQALVAGAAGARYVIPYVNRAARLLGDGLALVAEIAEVVAAQDEPAEILAASIKTPAEAAQAIIAGADHLTLPLDVLLALGNHELSDKAIAEFAAAATPGASAAAGRG